MATKNADEKNKISIGLIITQEHLDNSLFPEEVKNELSKSPFFLLIFISRENQLKISCFPTKTNIIKKILIRLKEFSPEVVKGISNVLNKLDLSKQILHTTGICYELENCFYETYLVGDALDTGKITLDEIKNEFMGIKKIVNINIKDIPIYN